MDAEKAVKQWDSFMRTTPTFEEFRDVEYIRQSGEINMVTDNLGRTLCDKGRYAGFLWLQRCRRYKVSWTSHYTPSMQHYTELYGPVSKWFTNELLLKWEEEDLQRQEDDLRDRLRSLRQKKQKIQQRKV